MAENGLRNNNDHNNNNNNIHRLVSLPHLLCHRIEFF